MLWYCYLGDILHIKTFATYPIDVLLRTIGGRNRQGNKLTHVHVDYGHENRGGTDGGVSHVPVIRESVAVLQGLSPAETAVSDSGRMSSTGVDSQWMEMSRKRTASGSCLSPRSSKSSSPTGRSTHCKQLYVSVCVLCGIYTVSQNKPDPFNFMAQRHKQRFKSNIFL